MDISLISAQYNNTVNNPYSAISNAQERNESSLFNSLLRRAQNSGSITDDGIDRTSELFEVCMELETILIKNMIKGMRSTVMKSNFIDTGFAGEVYEDLLYDEYAKTYARNAGLGFAEMAYRELAGIR